jgi:hypothetical protein
LRAFHNSFENTPYGPCMDYSSAKLSGPSPLVNQMAEVALHF